MTKWLGTLLRRGWSNLEQIYWGYFWRTHGDFREATWAPPWTEGRALDIKKLAGRKVGTCVETEPVKKKKKICPSFFLLFLLLSVSESPLMAPKPPIGVTHLPAPTCRVWKDQTPGFSPPRVLEKSIWPGPWALAGGICLQCLTQ